MERAVVVASANGRVGILRAMEVLRRGGSALDAVEAGVREVEANPRDHTVGYGGLPNLLGVVELDAAIMDGRTLATGAVGAIRGFPHPVSVARRVMEELPHVFLVGEGAERFAREMGFAPAELLTEEAREVWLRMLREEGGVDDPTRLPYLEKIRTYVNWAMDPEKVRAAYAAGAPDPPGSGTVNFLARDHRGDLAAATSTSGWAWKYPGRLGDSPVVGAGLYADNRYGAAACTGRGEMTIRTCTAYSLVRYLREGLPLEDAGRLAMEELGRLVDRYFSTVSVVAMDRHGHCAAFSNRAGATYVFMTEDMDTFLERDRIYIRVTEGRRESM
ncbi:MAG: N(4)-(beta-N-acetylglucosaminyl)-L-asparaginase [Bacillota bacterium]|nr:N(4)-(beta-N-acetylglucosaminyl)-L-asparaginase [Bacillota bacterium]MDI7249170.1 N(4)-(beta-N-acetylglucosaminyl)-L-asparaginase [Bacillota bacterium]